MHKYKTKVFLNKCQLSQMKPRHIDSSRALCGTFNRPGKVVGWTSTVASTVNIVRPTTVASLPHSTYIFLSTNVDDECDELATVQWLLQFT